MNYPKEILDQGALQDAITSYFSATELENLARETKFVERSSSRLSGQSFLMLNVFSPSQGVENSLMDQCDRLCDWFGIEMSKQSLDERYNTYAVAFMRQCLGKILSQRLLKPSNLLQGGVVKKILLTDATSFQLPAHLAIFYPGSAGSASEAMVKIHQRYDLLSGQPVDIQVVGGSSNDTLYKPGDAGQVEAGALYLSDLGYLDYGRLEEMQKAGAYYLSRAKSNICLRKSRGDLPFKSLADLLDRLDREQDCWDIPDVWVGKKQQFKTRLIIQRVSEAVAQKRLKKLNKNAKRNKKWKVSEQRKRACHFNVYVTNLPDEVIAAPHIGLIYSLRWQIELVFKIWKSLFGLDQVKPMSIFRFECLLYGKLIALLLTAQLQNVFKTHLWEEQQVEWSEWKAAKVIKKNGKNSGKPL